MIAAGQAAVSCNLISGQADTAPAAAPASAGDVYEELPQYPRLEKPGKCLCNLKSKPKQARADVVPKSVDLDRICIKRRYG